MKYRKRINSLQDVDVNNVLSMIFGTAHITVWLRHEDSERVFSYQTRSEMEAAVGEWLRLAKNRGKE